MDGGAGGRAGQGEIERMGRFRREGRRLKRRPMGVERDDGPEGKREGNIEEREDEDAANGRFLLCFSRFYLLHLHTSSCFLFRRLTLPPPFFL